MLGSARDHAHTSSVKLEGPSVPCDLCQTPFRLPAEIVAQGVIHGLLVCSQCVEDNLASAVEPRTEVGLVGSGGGRQ